MTRRFWLGVLLFTVWSVDVIFSLMWGKLDLLNIAVIVCGYIVAVGIAMQKWMRQRPS